MEDVGAKILRRLRQFRLLVLCRGSTVAMAIVMKLQGVQQGRGNRFWGRSVVVRYPDSSISIGDGCSFRSDRTSNLIGVSRPCILATHGDRASLTIGNACGFSGTVIGARTCIVVGNGVLCGANTLITDFDWHSIEPGQRRAGSGEARPVVIEDNVFLGYGTVVLKGVTIGKNSVIGANSVVTTNIPANVVAAGNPCRVLRRL